MLKEAIERATASVAALEAALLPGDTHDTRGMQVTTHDIGTIFACLDAVSTAEGCIDTLCTATQMEARLAEERALIEDLMAADRRHDEGYESADEYAQVLAQVASAKELVCVALQGRLDVLAAAAIGGTEQSGGEELLTA